MKLLLAVFAIVVAPWLLRRRQEPEPVRYHEPVGMAAFGWADGWRDWERVDSV